MASGAFTKKKLEWGVALLACKRDWIAERRSSSGCHWPWGEGLKHQRRRKTAAAFNEKRWTGHDWLVFDEENSVFVKLQAISDASKSIFQRTGARWLSQSTNEQEVNVPLPQPILSCSVFSCLFVCSLFKSHAGPMWHCSTQLEPTNKTDRHTLWSA